MKGFIILSLAINAILAVPQYNYPQPGLGIGSVSSSFGGSFRNVGGHGGGFGNAGVNGFSSGGFGGNTNSVAHQQIVTKQFLIHSAPQEQDEIGADKVINLGPGRKNYRVVFIKAPHQGVQAGKVRFIAPANEEKTVIYVLSKKTDAADIQADVQQAHSEPAKPEVHFIKYKTLEEAAHAQRTIQAQYDSIQGTSQISDEGIAPISSVIGALGDGGAGGAGAGGFGAGGHGGSSGGFAGSGNSFGTTGAGVSGSYLPPSH